MFVGKDRSLPMSGTSERHFIHLCSSLISKHYTRLERLVMDKHSSLLWKSVNYGQKKFYSIGPWGHNVIKLFMAGNKLERLSLANLSGRVLCVAYAWSRNWAQYCKSHHAEYSYAECGNAECANAECGYAECNYTASHFATILSIRFFLKNTDFCTINNQNQTQRHKDTKIHTQTHTHKAHRHTDTQTHRHTDTKTHRHTDNRHKYTQAHR